MTKKKTIGIEEITLRDFFAAFVIQSYMQNEIWNPDTYEVAARSAYWVADAMIEQRTKNESF